MSISYREWKTAQATTDLPIEVKEVNEVCGLCAKPVRHLLLSDYEQPESWWQEFWAQRPFLGIYISSIVKGMSSYYHGKCWNQ